MTVFASCAAAVEAIRPTTRTVAPHCLIMISSGIRLSRPPLHYVVARFCSRTSFRRASAHDRLCAFFEPRKARNDVRRLGEHRTNRLPFRERLAGFRDVSHGLVAEP